MVRECGRPLRSLLRVESEHAVEPFAARYSAEVLQVIRSGILAVSIREMGAGAGTVKAQVRVARAARQGRGALCLPKTSSAHRSWMYGGTEGRLVPGVAPEVARVRR